LGWVPDGRGIQVLLGRGSLLLSISVCRFSNSTIGINHSSCMSPYLVNLLVNLAFRTQMVRRSFSPPSASIQSGHLLFHCPHAVSSHCPYRNGAGTPKDGTWYRCSGNRAEIRRGIPESVMSSWHMPTSTIAARRVRISHGRLQLMRHTEMGRRK